MADTAMAPVAGSLSTTGTTVVYTGVDLPLIPGVGGMSFTGVLSPELLPFLTGAAGAYRMAADVTEQWIRNGRCRVYGVYPEVASTAGTVTLRDCGGLGNTTLMHVMPAATLGAGKTFGPKGLFFPKGLSIQLSNAADITLVAWEAV